MKRWFIIPIAVVAAPLALVAVLVLAGSFTMRTVLAGSPFGGPFGGGPWGGGPWGGPWAHGPGFELPAELQGLRDVPADQRFGHFTGAQISLKDKDGRPLTIAAIPGTVTAVDATSLTLAANDGTTKTYTLDDKTVIRGKLARGGAQATQPALAQNDKVVVVTINGSATATAVIAGGPDGFGPPWGHGPFGPGR